MIIEWLLPLHIAILGYWLGSELVINSTFRYVCAQPGIPIGERNRLMGHVMTVDQHVRYALVLQASLGPAIAIHYGYIPGGPAVANGFLAFGVLWLGFVELVHRLRHGSQGHILAAIDRASRYVLIALLLATAIGLIGADWPMPGWLRLKLGLFAAVVACGVGIRFALIGLFRTWRVIQAEGSNTDREQSLRQGARHGTAIVCLLWLFIAAITVISVWKPF
ncbi:hypothetical protein [Niveispirillum irakense]|uniref:hypothetical protein n=1 Tax=Niveispirillum irakense TaxID=34011 RepID=UPI0004289261|nr:hypothetical protein [Niveispirillum irakense]